MKNQMTMKKTILSSILSLFIATAVAQVSVTGLRTDGLTDPVGLSPTAPTLSWVVESDRRNTVQTAYEIRVTSGGATVWKTGKMLSDASTGVVYGGPICSDTRYEWRVRVWDNYGRVSEWASARWQTGIGNDEWSAEWITTDGNGHRPVYFRRTFDIDKKIVSATAYVTAHGWYEAYINGHRVGDWLLTPGWTSYGKRLQYQAYDVTSLLAKGRNAIGAIVADGWYKSGLGWKNAENNVYGDRNALLMQVAVVFSDGSRALLATDGTWKVSDGEIRYATLYHGQTTDRNSARDGWNTASFDDGDWQRVETADYGYGNIISTVNEPVVRHEVVKPVKYIVTPDGDKVLDFGQNLVGWEIACLDGRKGDTVRIYHAEVLDKDGRFYTTNLRSAKATSTYILSGEGKRRFEPQFTFYGFRYIKVEGIDGDLDPDDFAAQVVGSGIERNGSFSSSDEIINKLQSNIEWGLRGNFVDVPTDCPQRDERLGWTGDAQVFFRTATFLRNVNTFFAKWLGDLAADQFDNGAVPRIIPYVEQMPGRISSAWGDAATIIVWQHYMAYGDKSILVRQFDSMKRWVDYMVSQSRNWLWNNGNHYGDWLFWSTPNDRDGKSAVTNRHFIAQCFFARSAEIVAETARILGRDDDFRRYDEIRANAAKALLDEYVTPNGMVSSDTQTAYTLALHFDLLPENLRAQAARRLVENIRRYKYHITTGFVGTPYICHVLSRYGYADVAYELLLQKTVPSWIYPISMGATTIWERWDSMKPDGSIPNNGMNSFNHYSYGAIGDWLYREAVGLQETEAGFKNIRIKPHTGGGFTRMAAEEMTPYGRLAAEWYAENDRLKSLKVAVPVNTKAVVYVPATSLEAVTEGGKRLENADDVKIKGLENGYAVVEVGSGEYLFEVKL